MKIGYLGAGIWGYCLARLLANKGHTVVSWTIEKELVAHIKKHNAHPFLPDAKLPKTLCITENLEEALSDADIIVEAVTSKGCRPVFEQVASYGLKNEVPIVCTSKGIEQNTGLILPDVIESILGKEKAPYITMLSGPSFAVEVSKGLPASVVCGSHLLETGIIVADAFTTPTFRVYPNQDIRGVAIGGALKNIIAIACGISDEMKLGTGAKAALMTRGLHEMVKLATCLGCKKETLYGLSGMGDLFLTCSSNTSRNYSFGSLVAKGSSTDDAKKNIHMVVEGAYTAVSACQLAKKFSISMPISEMVLKIIDQEITPQEAVSLLMQRTIKEEVL